ncbi:gluconokinase [Ramlibacter sp. G-1-2-2]|uniref:Gluconokinase n=1 Tax=Ramlibacter agri TaxID=2728837 RepID=A0A848GY87_9BURK|nr:gluconokinase [Ramlibacter agri]NML43545.1 gluconokinase [Ramlibacter agri]
MGVAGSGKSTIARAVAAGTGRVLVEGDDFHPPENIRKMGAGLALTDDDRREWLARIAQQLAAHDAGVVVSCSALKLAYRDRLRAAAPGLRFAFLAITPQQARERVLARAGSHFFPPSVVDSQFATLEDPSTEPGVLRVDGGLPAAEVTARILDWMGAAAPNNETKQA